MDNEFVDNVYSIWTRREPCENMHLTIRQFINFSATDKGSVHVISCHDCSARYSITNKLLIESHMRKE